MPKDNKPPAGGADIKRLPPERAAVFEIATVLLGSLIGGICTVHRDMDVVRLAVASWAANDGAWERLASQLAEMEQQALAEMENQAKAEEEA
jgi:hypothetical protein